jgi:hypothetical protein
MQTGMCNWMKHHPVVALIKLWWHNCKSAWHPWHPATQDLHALLQPHAQASMPHHILEGLAVFDCAPLWVKVAAGLAGT